MRKIGGPARKLDDHQSILGPKKGSRAEIILDEDIRSRNTHDLAKFGPIQRSSGRVDGPSPPRARGQDDGSSTRQTPSNPPRPCASGRVDPQLLRFINPFLPSPWGGDLSPSLPFPVAPARSLAGRLDELVSLFVATQSITLNKVMVLIDCLGALWASQDDFLHFGDSCWLL